MIDRKYVGRNIWMAFPIGGDWYLMPHDRMVELAEKEGITQTASWIDGGAYSMPRPSKATVANCGPFRSTPIEEVAAAAAKDPADQAGERRSTMP